MQNPADANLSAHADDAGMFALAPVSLWLEDYSALKRLFADWRDAGVTDLRAHLLGDPRRVKECSALIKVIKVNRATLALFEASDLEHLVAGLDRVFRDDMLTAHVDELVQLWDGKSAFSSHTVNYSLTGRRIDIQLKGAILPGHEATWDRVLIAIEDVTERETARRHLARATFTHGVSLSTPRCRSGSRISPPSSACSTRCASAASSISACSPTCIRNSSRAA